MITPSLLAGDVGWGDLVWGNRGSLRGDRGGGGRPRVGGGGFFYEGTEDSDVTRKEEIRPTLGALMCRRTTV